MSIIGKTNGIASSEFKLAAGLVTSAIAFIVGLGWLSADQAAAWTPLLLELAQNVVVAYISWRGIIKAVIAWKGTAPEPFTLDKQ